MTSLRALHVGGRIDFSLCAYEDSMDRSSRTQRWLRRLAPGGVAAAIGVAFYLPEVVGGRTN